MCETQNIRIMLEKTKVAIKVELTKNIIYVTTCSDPAPMLGSGLHDIVKAMKRDIQKAFKKDKILSYEENHFNN